MGNFDKTGGHDFRDSDFLVAKTMQVSQVDVDDNVDLPNYRCCCQKCHVTRGATIIGILEAVLCLVTAAGFSTLFVLRGRLFAVAFAAGITVTITMFVSIILLFIGLRKNKPELLLPHLVIQVIGMVVAICVAVAVVISLVIASEVVMVIANFEPPPLPTLPPPPALPAFGPLPALPALKDFPRPPALPPPPFAQEFKEHLDQAVDKFAVLTPTVGLIVLVALYLTMGIGIWFFIVILKAYKFMKRKTFPTSSSIPLTTL